MNCRKCNAELEDGEKICRWCGTENATDHNIKSKKKFVSLVVGTFGLVILLLVIMFMLFGKMTHSSQDMHKSSGTGVTVKSTSTEMKNDTTGTKIVPTNKAQDITDTDSNTSNENASNEIQNIFYTKGKDLSVYYTQTDQVNPQMLVRDYKSIGILENEFYISKDGKRIAYLKNVPKSNGYELFYCDLRGSKMVTYKIDSNISLCKVNEDVTKVYYLRGEDLYISNMKGKEKIESNVKEFYINKAGDCVVYKTNDDFVSLKQVNKKSEGIGQSVDLKYISEDLKTIYFIQDKTLYRKQEGHDPVVIASNVLLIIQIYNTGEVYYISSNNNNVNDLSDGDGTVPNSVDDLSLYFYSEGTSKLIQEHCINAQSTLGSNGSRIYQSENKQPLVVFKRMDIADKASSESDQNSQSENYVCIGSKVIGSLGKGDLFNFRLNAKEDKLYYKEMNSSSLYYVTIKDGSLSKKATYSNEVIDYTLDGNSVLYFNQGGDYVFLYMNNKLIDRDVYVASIKKIENSNRYVYYKENAKTLMLYQDGKTIKIADHVRSYYVYDDNKITYVKSDEHGVKSLYLYTGTGNDIQLDQDVLSVLQPRTTFYGYGNETN
jgi:hypothetical protein